MLFMRKLDETQMQTTDRRAKIPIVYRVAPCASLIDPISPVRLQFLGWWVVLVCSGGLRESVVGYMIIIIVVVVVVVIVVVVMFWRTD